MKQGMFIFSYLLILAIEAYFIRSVKVLYSPYVFLGAMAAFGLLLNFVFLFVFGKSEKPLIPLTLYQLIQAALGFLIAYFLFHLSWQESLAYPAGALSGLVAFAVIRSGQGLRSALLAVLLAAGFTISLRLSSVSGGLLFALALLNGFYLGSRLLAGNLLQAAAWEGALIFTASLALGRAAIQYYLIQSGYDALGVVVTQPYTFIGLFAGIFTPLLYVLALRDRVAGAFAGILILGLFFPWLLGIFIHVRPFAGYLLGFTVSAFTAGILLQGPLSLGLLGYLTYASGAAGLTVFSLLSNLSRGVRLGILAGVFALSVLAYVLKNLIQKNSNS